MKRFGIFRQKEHQKRRRKREATSPGAISGILLNDYYDSHEDYVFALAREMKNEYELIAESDLLLQLDCPDLAMERHWLFKDLSTDAFKDVVSLHIDAINKAVEKIVDPPGDNPNVCELREPRAKGDREGKFL